MNPLRRALPLLAVVAATPVVAATTVSVNGKAVAFPRAQPLRIGATLFLPLREVAEAMGATYLRGPLARRITVIRGNRHVELSMAGGHPTIDGIPQRMVVYPQVSKGEVLVSLAFVSKVLKATTVYNAKQGFVRIYSR